MASESRSRNSLLSAVAALCALSCLPGAHAYCYIDGYVSFPPSVDRVWWCCACLRMHSLIKFGHFNTGTLRLHPALRIS
ncbi:hypothetical protein C8Q70DRAFT_978493 [Cubamyces menziesii]|nr:hypothetical protein C8Q70DRAFT_978493 [Cubamyces menziesii]